MWTMWLLYWPADRWPYEPLAALELLEAECVAPKSGVSCSEPSELRVRLWISRYSEIGECESALFRLLPIILCLGLVCREPEMREKTVYVTSSLNTIMSVTALMSIFSEWMENQENNFSLVTNYHRYKYLFKKIQCKNEKSQGQC